MRLHLLCLLIMDKLLKLSLNNEKDGRRTLKTTKINNFAYSIAIFSAYQKMKLFSSFDTTSV